MVDLKKNMNHLRDESEPAAGLSEKILRSIERTAERRRERNAAAFGVLLFSSVGFVAFSVVNLVHALAQSGFLQFVALLFSDFSAMAANLPDFLFSIAESFPAFSFAFLFSGLFLAVWSAAKFFHELSSSHGHKFSPLTPRA